MTRVNTSPPFRATIEMHIWPYARERAAAVVEQLVQVLATQATNDQGGVAVHHEVYSVKVERSA